MLFRDSSREKMISCVHDAFIPFSFWIQGWDLCVGDMSLKCVLLLCPTSHFPLSIYCHNTEALNHSREKRFGNNRKAEMWRSGWSLQGIMSITSWGGEKMEENSFVLMSVFKSVAMAVKKKGINYMPIKVHTRWNSTLCWCYVISPGECRLLTLFSWWATEGIQKKGTFTNGGRSGSGWMQPYVFTEM